MVHLLVSNVTSSHEVHPPAPLLKRGMAFLYDIFILTALSMGYSAVATLVMANLVGQSDAQEYLPMQQGPWFQLGWVMTIAGFYWFFFKRAGQTVGMRAWRLKIESIDGSKVSHRQILLRILIAPFALGLCGLGYWWCLFNKDRAAWQDLASQSRVVVLPKPQKTKKAGS